MSAYDRHLFVTGDGSHSMHWEKFGGHYHAVQGAWMESDLVFIERGLRVAPQTDGPLEILEMGFGTGLNALLACMESDSVKKEMRYTGAELYPLSTEEYAQLNFGKVLPHPQAEEWTARLHTAPWGTDFELSPLFTARKLNVAFEQWIPDRKFHVVFYDAFAPNPQPELWTQDLFARIYESMHSGGVLTTYCAKGVVKRALKAVGFKLETLPGPPGKREMTRVVKP